MGDARGSQPGTGKSIAPRLTLPLALYVAVAAAVAFGLWARFKGLGSWPLYADEYYIARSVQNILRSGLPEYACGGYYTRGLIFQYAAALLQLFGISAELAPRLLAALASLATLPAAYLLGVRVRSRTVGLIAVALLAVSTWEVDIARFGRMYAPFQAMFAWYLLYFIRYAIDREARALWPMLALTVVGVFTWEGGIFMTLANLLPPFIRSPAGGLSRRDMRYLAGASLLVALTYLFTMAPFRTMGPDPFPLGYARAAGAASDDAAPFAMPSSAASWITTLLTAGALAGLSIAALRWIWSLRERWPAALGLAAALGCALAGQFAAVGTLIVVLLLIGMVEWRELTAPRARMFAAAILGCALAWLAFLVLAPNGLPSTDLPWGRSNRLLALTYAWLGLPDYIGVVVVPWTRSAPILGALLFAAAAWASLRLIGRGRQPPSAEQAILLLLVALLAGAAMSDPPRYETRYVFFLFPAALVIAVALLAAAVSRWPREDAAALATLAIAASALAVAGDFKPRRLLAIDSAAVTFGLHIGAHAKTNTLGRADTRGAAMWLRQNALEPGILIINGYPGVDFYYPHFDAAYIDMDNQRYEAFACGRGTVERWGNLPLIASVNDLQTRMAGRKRTLIVVESTRLQALLAGLRAPRPRVAWTSVDGAISILDTGSAPVPE